MDEGSSLSFERIADRYDETRGGTERAERFAGVVRKHLARGDALEVGVGTGIVAAALTHDGWSVVGIDLAPAMLKKAQARIGNQVAVADARSLPFPDGCMRSAYSAWVLQLVDDKRAALEEVSRVLGVGGRFVVISSWRNPADPIDEVLRQVEIGSPVGERRNDSAERLTPIAHEAGLQLVATDRVSPNQFTESPHHIAEQLEQRTFSYTWDLNDATWERVVTPAIDQLRAMPDEPIERSHSNVVSVFERL